jgi:hypothetical protein
LGFLHVTLGRAHEEVVRIGIVCTMEFHQHLIWVHISKNIDLIKNLFSIMGLSGKTK